MRRHKLVSDILTYIDYNPDLNIGCITDNFSVSDKVMTPFGDGEVWKVRDKSVRVKHWDEKRNVWMFSKYLTNPWHQSQNHVYDLKLIK